MRKITFPKIALTINEQDGDKVKVVPVTASQLLALALWHAPQGLTGAEISKRHQIAEKLSKANSHLLLEEEQWTLLNPLVQDYRWPWGHTDIVKICDAVSEASVVEVEERPNRAERRRKAKK